MSKSKEEINKALEKYASEKKLISKKDAIKVLSKGCEDVMMIMDDEIDILTNAKLTVALAVMSAKTVERLFELEEDMPNYSEKEEI